MIVVCPNTLVSKLVYDWIAGTDVKLDDDTSIPKPGELALLSNVTTACGHRARAPSSSTRRSSSRAR